MIATQTDHGDGLAGSAERPERNATVVQWHGAAFGLDALLRAAVASPAAPAWRNSRRLGPGLLSDGGVGEIMSGILLG